MASKKRVDERPKCRSTVIQCVAENDESRKEHEAIRYDMRDRTRQDEKSEGLQIKNRSSQSTKGHRGDAKSSEWIGIGRDRE